MTYSIYFKYKTTGKKDKVSFLLHSEFMDAYNSLTNYCKDFILVTSTRWKSDD